MRVKEFKHGTFPMLQRKLYRACRQRGHCMVHAVNWRWRTKCMNERYYCRYCDMEAFIQYHPPVGFGQLHGVAICVSCTYDEKHDCIVNFNCKE